MYVKYLKNCLFFKLYPAPKIIMENKCDLLGEEEKYNDSIEELKQFSENNGFSGFFRTKSN